MTLFRKTYSASLTSIPGQANKAMLTVTPLIRGPFDKQPDEFPFYTPSCVELTYNDPATAMLELGNIKRQLDPNEVHSYPQCFGKRDLQQRMMTAYAYREIYAEHRDVVSFAQKVFTVTKNAITNQKDACAIDNVLLGVDFLQPAEPKHKDFSLRSFNWRLNFSLTKF